jgi:soluble P-type ATPase
MKAILVFIDGTICDASERIHLISSPDFYRREWMLEDRAVEGSAKCLQALAQRYQLVYIGARPASTHHITTLWLEKNGFPKGEIYLGEEQEKRLALVSEMKGTYDFIAGIGDRWDDNELHAELGCMSIILQEHTGRWNEVTERIDRYHRNLKVQENRIRLQGKVEGLARVCPMLLAKFGAGLWEAYFSAVLEMAESTRESRREEDLASFEHYHLDPSDLRDAATRDEFLRQEDWENNTVYGLQEYSLVEASRNRYVHKITSCYYAELWRMHGAADIGYQVHCRTDWAWWDRPAWNPAVRFEQPSTLMQGDDCCLFIQFIPGSAD